MEKRQILLILDYSVCIAMRPWLAIENLEVENGTRDPKESWGPRVRTQRAGCMTVQLRGVVSW